MDSVFVSLKKNLNELLDRPLISHTKILNNKNGRLNKKAQNFTEHHPLQADGEAFFKQNKSNKVLCPNEIEKCSRIVAFMVYLHNVIIMYFAHFREFLRYYGFEKNLAAVERKEQQSFAPLYSAFDSMFTRNCHNRIRDTYEVPICKVAEPEVTLLNRDTNDLGFSLHLTGSKSNVVNVASYNYLGFSQSKGPCAEEPIKAIDEMGLSTGSTIYELGHSKEQAKLEKLVAEFMGVEEAICFPMGFGTNALNLPCLADKNTLVISDQLNHVSIVLGARLSGATVKIFKHNDIKGLEQIIRDAIVFGDLKTNKPYKKILIVIEGLYSMEGSFCNLPAIIALKKKYNCYLYMDEAHSIGAMGDTGRGVSEYWGCNPKDVDVLMGTFTKGFGSMGGYIAGTHRLIKHIRAMSSAGYHGLPMSPPIARHICTGMSIVMGRNKEIDGQKVIELLKRNARYFRLKLKQKGFIVYGSDDSPVVPLVVYQLTKIGLWGRELRKRGVGTAVISFPGTELAESRVRFCVSAAHTKEQLDYVLEASDVIGDLAMSKHSYRKDLYKDMDIKW